MGAIGSHDSGYPLNQSSDIANRSPEETQDPPLFHGAEQASIHSDQVRAAELRCSVFFQKIVVEQKCDAGLSPGVVFNRIQNGEKIARQILTASADDQPPPATKEAVRDLLWYMTSQSFENEGDSFPRGTVRVMDQNSDQLVDYMMSCQSAYSRISSHYNEITEGKQYGINFEPGELPYRELKTVLFAKTNRPEGESKLDMFFKLETEGFSPRKDLGGAIKHSYHWLRHLVSGGGETTINGESTRRETDIQELKRSYKDLQAIAVRSSLLRKKELKAVVKGESSDRLFHIRGRLDLLGTLIEANLERQDSVSIISEAHSVVLENAIATCREQLSALAQQFPDDVDTYGHVRFGRESIIALMSSHSVANARSSAPAV